MLGHDLLRDIALCTGTLNLFGRAFQAVYVLYLFREPQLQPVMVGVLRTTRSVGFLCTVGVQGLAARGARHVSARRDACG